jgi:two-component sensor histidine kinase
MLLSERGWQEVPLKDIVFRQVSIFGNSRVNFNGPDIMVPAPFVQPIGLAVHELAANAAVHGAFSQSVAGYRSPGRPTSIGLSCVTRTWEDNSLGILISFPRLDGIGGTMPFRP